MLCYKLELRDSSKNSAKTRDSSACHYLLLTLR